MIPTQTLRLRLRAIGVPGTIPVNDKETFLRDFHDWLEGGSCLVFVNRPGEKNLLFIRPLAKEWWEQWT